MPDTGSGFVYMRSGAEREAERAEAPEVEAEVEAETEDEAENLEDAPAQEPEPQDELEDAPDADGYPEDGTIPDVKAWVGDDLDRAEAALAAEMEKDPPRVTLVEYLENLLG